MLIGRIFAKKASVYSKKIQVTTQIFQGIKKNIIIYHSKALHNLYIFC